MNDNEKFIMECRTQADMLFKWVVNFIITAALILLATIRLAPEKWVFAGIGLSVGVFALAVLATIAHLIARSTYNKALRLAQEGDDDD